MFLELHLFENDEKIMLNMDKIQSIYQIKGATNIYIGEVVYRVKENYDEIKEIINDACYKAESEVRNEADN